MCDSLIALKSDTVDGVAVFAKNSDRPANEGQFIKFVPAEDHPAGSTVKCTYIEIPQVPHTNAVLLSKPYWIWGAEMGVNDKYVVIGNEAVFPKVPNAKNTKLIGMDFVRLGLERGNTAREALDVIIDLLNKHGQGGSCTTDCESYYSSFLIADADDAWVLETAGSWYATKHVTQSDSISNYLTIGTDYDPNLSSPDLAQYAVQQGWAKSTVDFNFGAAYNDFFLAYILLTMMSLFGTLSLILSFDQQTFPALFSERLPRRGISIFLIVSGVILFCIWLLLSIVPALVAGIVPAEVASYTTIITFVLDMGIIAPALVISGRMLSRREPLGYVLASVLLVFIDVLGSALIVMGFAQEIAGLINLGQFIGFVVSFAILTLFSLGFTIALFRSITDSEFN